VDEERAPTPTPGGVPLFHLSERDRSASSKTDGLPDRREAAQAATVSRSMTSAAAADNVHQASTIAHTPGDPLPHPSTNDSPDFQEVLA
jgi:hypothetical protein